MITPASFVRMKRSLVEAGGRVMTILRCSADVSVWTSPNLFILAVLEDFRPSPRTNVATGVGKERIQNEGRRFFAGSA